LRNIALAVQGAIRTEDVFARYGGEEFAVLVRAIDHDAAAVFADRLRKTVAMLEVPVVDADVSVTISAGVASLTEMETATPDALLMLADERLYQAKTEGRDRVVS